MAESGAPAEGAQRFVVKRDGTQQSIDESKIKARIAKMAEGLNAEYLNLDVITQKVMSGIYSGKWLQMTNSVGVSTTELDNLAAETCAYMNIVHPHYSKLAARLAVSNLHKETSADFFEVMTVLRSNTDKRGKPTFGPERFKSGVLGPVPARY